MGRIKSGSDNITHILTEREINYLKILNLALSYNTMKDKIISGFLYFVCHSRFGYEEDKNLIFEINLEDEKRELKVREIPTEAISEALQES